MLVFILDVVVFCFFFKLIEFQLVLLKALP